LLDEPTASLDPDATQEICRFILEQVGKTGLSILFTSHKMEEASELCNRVVFLNKGKIIANDVPQKLASSVSAFCLRLTVVDGMKRLSSLAEKRKLGYLIDHRSIQIDIKEDSIPSFLGEIEQLQIVYSNIKIEEPSLEEYFLQITRKNEL
jgi:ABC-2 type transport system ATP-binding protein